VSEQSMNHPLPEGGQPARVLFVDDDPRVFQGMTRALRPFRDEFEIQGQDSVDAAIREMRRWQPAILVSDVSMPGQNGLDLLVASDEALRTTPVIMLTGNAQSDLKRKALNFGAIDLLNKPVAIEDLVARLRNAIRLRRYEDHIRTENIRLEGQVRRRTDELERAHAEMVVRLAIAAEFRDKETAAHVCRVELATAEIARRMGLEARRLETLKQAAALHDLGKIGIPDSILHKPARLDDDERRIMKNHCRIGWEMLRADVGIGHSLMADALIPDSLGAEDASRGNEVLDLAAQIALSHHERWDGSGYPDGKRGEEIPLEARIVAVADVFEALCHQRPYKGPLRPPDAAAIIEREAGAHFDPDVTRAFRRAMPEIIEIFNRFADRADAPACRAS